MGGLRQALEAIRIVNAYGLVTRLSGGLMPEEPDGLFDLAYRSSYDVVELQCLASAVITPATGAEAAIVTNGAAAGLLLAAAACLARQDAAIMDRLPVPGPVRQIIIGRSHRNAYDHALRTAGAELLEVGIPDVVSGAGVRDVELWEFEAAIGPATAAIVYVARHGARPALEEICELARRRSVPVIVDAAAQLPPVANLSRFIEAGADLVVFSGGKAIMGPQASGILCGRRDLVASALLQNLDLDVDATDRRRLLESPLFVGLEFRGFPHHGIGRAAKVGKETIIPFLFAFERFVRNGEEGFRQVQAELCADLADRLAGSNSIECRTILDHPKFRFPVIEITLRDWPQGGMDQFRRSLAGLKPSIRVGFVGTEKPSLLLNLSALRHEDVTYLAGALIAQLREPEGDGSQGSE